MKNIIAKIKNFDIKKVLPWIKNNLRTIEKITILIGSILILAIGLIFNILADTMVSITVGYLIYGLLTGITGGTLLLLGLNTNLFDVKIKGLIFVGIGLVLSIASIFVFSGYLGSEAFANLSEVIKSTKNEAGETISEFTKAHFKTIFNLLSAFSIVSCVFSAVGFGSQLYRKIKNIED